jgi:hypothetical protein
MSQDTMDKLREMNKKLAEWWENAGWLEVRHYAIDESLGDEYGPFEDIMELLLLIESELEPKE